MSRGLRRGLLLLLAGAGLVVATPGTAAAHPLGNFTVNRYTGLVVSTDAVTVEHVRDLAEIPTAQARRTIDTPGDGAGSPRELRSWAGSECMAAAADLRLYVDRTPTPLTVRGARARLLPGQAGLPVLRLECRLHGPADVTGVTPVRLTDEAADREVGWKEMTAAGDGVTLTRSDVPTRTVTDRLTSYPDDLLSSPLDVTTARLLVRPGGPQLSSAPAGAAPSGELGRGVDALTRAFEGLLDGAGHGPLLALGVLLAAVALGAAHAVAPGHGKTLMALYLGGRHAGALRSAAMVGATVTVTHTAGVLLLGVLVSAGATLAPAKAYPWVSLSSGLLVVAVGLALLRPAARRHAAQHDQDHDHPHDHPHGHRHEQHHQHGHPHPHSGRPSRPGLVAIGMAGGLLPSPSAVVVFLGASALGRPWFGVALVIAFGLGMAATLAAVGLLAMRLRERAESRVARHPSSRLAPLLRLSPLVTGTALTGVGVALAFRGAAATGVL